MNADGGDRRMDWPVVGAFAFGVLLGWYVYYINRYRKGEIQIGDIVTLVGAIGGGAVLALFNEKNKLFGAYGVGLAVGFFAYFRFRFVSFIFLLSINVVDDNHFLKFADGFRLGFRLAYGCDQEICRSSSVRRAASRQIQPREPLFG
jgi:hypothetical protein